jgi:hypothetical protein
MEVTWARPMIRAEVSLRKAADLFESGKVSAGMDEVANAQRQLALIAEFFVEAECRQKTSTIS